MSSSASARLSLLSTAYSRSFKLVVALRQPQILARFLTYLDWPSLHALLDTSRVTRALFSRPALLDVILARFVPGYLASRRPAVAPNLPVPIDIHDLQLFLISQSFPVHLYPSHALRSLFSLLPPSDAEEPLVSLTSAHSRFVLLLQSLVHSSHNFTAPPEPSHADLFNKLCMTLPELTSPAPLSYSPRSPTPPSTPPPPPPRHICCLKSKSSLTRRLSFFKSRTSSPPPPPPPPPLAEPHAFKAYRASWRRSMSQRRSSEAYSQSGSESDLTPPRRRYVSGSPSSNSRSSLSRSSTPTPPTSTSNSSPSPPPSRPPFTLSMISAPPPLDFAHATSPTRAPVLRVYVPCGAPTPDPQTIMRCEEQLVVAKLWSHLSTGDIVVNLGHVPQISDPTLEAFAFSDDTRPQSLFRSPPAPGENWLIFNGLMLVPFCAAPLPVPDPLSLPSPFYYTHILPRLANPVLALRRMPRFTTAPPAATGAFVFPPRRRSQPPIQTRLLRLPTRVKTTRGGGAALVRRYKWVARVYVSAPRVPGGEDGTEGELGAGWEGEWVLEGDGTKEGRETLMEWLVGRGAEQGKGTFGHDEQWEWEWELVRERCGKGRIWMRLLHVRKPGEVDMAELGAEALDRL
ncbi:hypothetical protein H0H81_011344 [Sphagnurus paluster]|uniref:Uncharacterized protein n=1 Tax=Sphagnurus paluster TaxID=117069 RepID=A0A9P7K775_9AGAR|nr:hypothetical protein H0H81_011344 [Sphagnurus paluster]